MYHSYFTHVVYESHCLVNMYTVVWVMGGSNGMCLKSKYMFSWASIDKSVLINEGWRRFKMSMSWDFNRTHKYKVKLVFVVVDSLGGVILEGFGKTLCL